jgi:hypothetical protein
MNKFHHFWMLSQDLGVMIFLGQFRLSKQSVNLLMANTVEIFGSFATLGLGYKVVGILL